MNTRESKAMKEVAGIAGLHSEHGECRPGLGRISAGAAADRNAVLCGRAAVAGDGAGVSADLRAAHHDAASPIGSPQPAAGDAGRGGASRGESQTELFPMAKANEAIEKVKKNKVRYRAVLVV